MKIFLMWFAVTLVGCSGHSDDTGKVKAMFLRYVISDGDKNERFYTKYDKAIWWNFLLSEIREHVSIHRASTAIRLVGSLCEEGIDRKERDMLWDEVPPKRWTGSSRSDTT